MLFAMRDVGGIKFELDDFCVYLQSAIRIPQSAFGMLQNN